MNVIVSNKYAAMLGNLNIDLIKSINGEFDVDEIINIQPVGSKAKPYQVKQIRNIILKYKFGGLE